MTIRSWLYLIAKLLGDRSDPLIIPPDWTNSHHRRKAEDEAVPAEARAIAPSRVQ